MSAKIDSDDITEGEFLDMLITDTKRQLSLAHLLGWTAAHFRPAQTSHGWRTAVAGDGAGFPDLVLARVDDDTGRTIFAELKKKGEKPRPEQRVWLDLLYDAGEEVYLWYPPDLDEIAVILSHDTVFQPGRIQFKSDWGNRR